MDFFQNLVKDLPEFLSIFIVLQYGIFSFHEAQLKDPWTDANKWWLGWSKVKIKLDKRLNGLGPPIPGIEGLDITTKLTFDVKTLQKNLTTLISMATSKSMFMAQLLPWNEKNTNVEIDIKCKIICTTQFSWNFKKSSISKIEKLTSSSSWLPSDP